MANKTEQISVRMAPELHKVLMKIEERHGITAPEIARRCLEQIAEFYEVNGWIGFPLTIKPHEDMLKKLLATNPALQFTAPKARPSQKGKKKDDMDGTVIFKN